MASFNPARIIAETMVQHVAYHDVLDSTNDAALAELAGGEVTPPLLVLADQQRAGRGRGQNRWWSAPGSLTFSLVVDGSRWDLSARCWPRISLGTSLAVAEVLRSLVLGEDVQLKWPNDVYLRSKKVCGILVESSPRQPNLLVIGVGINVNNSFSKAPHDLRDKAISLVEVTGNSLDREEVLIHVLRQLSERLQQLGTRHWPLADRWAEHCMLQGRTVSVESGAQKYVGVCQGIDDEGALLLQSDAGLQKLFAGVVAKIL
jgi:BirA family biotin operon repressor/biotin-[acetyl-CoA-carboxylase] ligase